jgi:hypothetical protein
MIFLRCAAFRASAGCCSVLRIGILAEALREIRWRFDPAFLLRSWQRRLSRALCGIGGAEIGDRAGRFLSQMAAPFVPRIVRDKWRGVRGIAGLFLSLSAS